MISGARVFGSQLLRFLKVLWALVMLEGVEGVLQILVAVAFVGAIYGRMDGGVAHSYGLLRRYSAIVSGLGFGFGFVVAVIKEDAEVAMSDEDSPIGERETVFEETFSCKGNFLSTS